MTGKDLLLKLLDYNYRSSIFPDESKPSMIREQQIECLLEALKLTKNHVNPLVKATYGRHRKKRKLSRPEYLFTLSNIEYFEKGEFLRDRPEEENQEISERAIKKIKELYEYIPEDTLEEMIYNRPRPVDIEWMFNHLLRFRQRIHGWTYPLVGMEEGFSVGLLYSIYLGTELTKVIKENLSEIDNTLWLIIDPKKQAFSIDQLIEEYGYPDADLEKIDLEWERENY